MTTEITRRQQRTLSHAERVASGEQYEREHPEQEALILALTRALIVAERVLALTMAEHEAASSE